MSEYDPNKIPCRVDDESHEWMNTEHGVVCCECGIPKEKPAKVEIERKRICAVLLSDLGHLVPHTCRPTMSQCEEYCESFFPAWERMKELGCRIVQAELTIVE